MNFDFSNVKVLLIGDFMIDHYIMGKSTRMSPEAPVPVIIPEIEYSIPGGAGNVAMNLASLGANITCLGFVGNDIWGEKLISILNRNKIDTKKIEVIDGHTTTLKKRIFSNNKQISRIDYEKIIDWEGSDINKTSYNDYDIIILSDYNKGALNRSWFKNPSSLKVIVDPKKEDFSHYKDANIITPNLSELEKASKIKITNDQILVRACKNLIKSNNLDYILAKKGARGMTLVGQDNFIKHIKPHKVKKPDVTGAGDTVISVFSLAFTVTKNIELSAKIANAAAAISVSKVGTSTVSLKELFLMRI